jgi:hypothetical protein
MSILSSLSPLKKRTVFKIAVDLIKADNRIHSKEINVLDRLQDDLCLSQQEIDLTHYITLSEAISSINEMTEEQVSYIIDLFNGIMRADSDISIEENILLTALSLACSKDSRDWVKVITIPATETKVSDSQIVFLEKEWSRNAHQVFDDKYDNLLISKAFGDIGFQLFYLPSVMEDLGLKNKSGNELGRHFGLLQKSIGYLTPYGTRSNDNKVEKILTGFDTTTFFKVVLSSLHLNPDIFPFNSFLLIKVRENIVFDDNNCSKEVIDFLCIDMSDEIKKRILTFVSNFNEQTFMLPYEGYYKMFYDYLSSESKITSSIFLDDTLHFEMENLGNTRIKFESSPQARTFYLLLLHYGRSGVKQSCFCDAIDYLKNVNAEEFCINGKFSIGAVKTRLIAINTDWSKLIYNIITIYQSISTKDEQKPSYLSYILSILNHRSSLKTYVNTGFSEIEGLANPEQYHISFDKEFNLYRVTASSALFFKKEGEARIPLTSSIIWKSII